MIDASKLLDGVGDCSVTCRGRGHVDDHPERPTKFSHSIIHISREVHTNDGVPALCQAAHTGCTDAAPVTIVTTPATRVLIR
jgi:hypothetical protein